MKRTMLSAVRLLFVLLSLGPLCIPTMAAAGPGRVKTEKRGLEIVCQLENILIEATDLSQSVGGFHGRTLPVKVQIRVDPAAFAAAEFSHGLGQYPQTVAALQERYADEVIARQHYRAYAAHADSEGYPAIAHLFRALAASEAVHARNFAGLLRQMGAEPADPAVKLELSSTRTHLQQAATVEAAEIDTEYPAILQRIAGEQHEQAIRLITYAWKAEQQHRDLIVQIKKGASWFFGMLVSRIEGSPTRYYICQICGSTVTELPSGQCPICDHPPEQYREVR